MPPLPGAYQATFVVSSVSYGFDIEQPGGYSSSVEANATVKSVPWAAAYAVVVQSAGILPLPRQYKVILWTEADYLALALQVNKSGTLTTPREGAVAAFLNKIERGEVDRTTAVGATKATLSFTLQA